MTDSTISLAEQHDKIALLKELLTPRVVGLTKCKIGALADGGYILAQELIPEHRVVYSLGIGDDVSFDLEIAKTCDRILQFDGTIPDLPHNNPKFVFTNANIDSAAMNDNMRSIPEHEHQNNILLKMDIEGAEYELLAGLEMDNLLKISQICMELHFPIMASSSCIDLLMFLTSEFELFHLHVNNAALTISGPGYKVMVDDLPNLLELTFIRKDKCLFSKRETRAFPLEGFDYPNLPNLPDIPANWWLQL